MGLKSVKSSNLNKTIDSSVKPLFPIKYSQKIFLPMSNFPEITGRGFYYFFVGVCDVSRN